MKIRAVLAAALLALLAACAPAPSDAAGDGVLKVGATARPHAEILTFVKDNLAAKAGLKMEIVEFGDYVQPNVQLDEGQLGANFFQHKPYLEDFNSSKGTKLTFLTPVHLEPLGLYSTKITDPAALAQGATVAVPSDATNLGRALKLLADNGVIKLKEDAGASATERDVTDNPKKLEFRPIEAAQLPRSLDDVDAAVINGNYAIEAGLKPASQALLLEKTEGNPYVNGLVVRSGHERDADVVKLSELLRSKEVKAFIAQRYAGAVVAA